MTSHTHLYSKLDEFGKDFNAAIKKRVSKECVYLDVLHPTTTTSEQSPGHHAVASEQSIRHYTTTGAFAEQSIALHTITGAFAEQSPGHHTMTYSGPSTEQSSEHNTTTGTFAEQSPGHHTITYSGPSTEQNPGHQGTTTGTSAEQSPGHHTATGTFTEQSTATCTSSEHHNIQILLQPDKGRKITFDNFDIHQEVHHMTEQNQNKDKHYATVMSTENRISGAHLRRDDPVGDIAALDNGKCVPNHAEHQKQKEDYVVLVSRIITANIQCLKHLEEVVTKHIPHRYQRETARATDTVCAIIMIIFFLVRTNSVNSISKNKTLGYFCS